MKRRLSLPFAPIESRQQAVALTRYSVVGFGIWGAVLLLQGGLVWGGYGTEPVEYRGATTGFAVFQAMIAAMAAFYQWRKPNRILPVFGLAWSLYELSSLMVGLAVGMPMAMGGLPSWAAGVTALAMFVCAIMHCAGLRSASALLRMN